MTAQTPTSTEVLDLAIGDNDIGATTVREFLVAHFVEFYTDGHGRLDDGPVLVALIRAGFVDGAVDGDDYLDGWDSRQHAEIMEDAIRSLGVTS